MSKSEAVTKTEHHSIPLLTLEDTFSFSITTRYPDPKTLAPQVLIEWGEMYDNTIPEWFRDENYTD